MTNYHKNKMPGKFKVGDPVKIGLDALIYATATLFFSSDNPIMENTGRIIAIIEEKPDTYLYQVRLDSDNLQIGGVLDKLQHGNETRYYHDCQLSIDTRARRDDNLEQILELKK